MSKRAAAPARSEAPLAPPPLPTRRFPSVLLGALVLILILCALLGAGAYLYASATHLISEYRRHLNSAADRAQLYFDQREVLLRAIAATAVRPDEVSLTPGAQTLQPVAAPGTHAEDRHELLLTRRHWAALRRTGTLIYSQLHPARSYRLAQAGNTQAWQAQGPALALRLGIINTDPQARQATVIWLRQPESPDPRLVAYTPIDRTDREGGWLGLELKDIDSILALSPPPPGTEYILFNIRGQAVLYSSAPPVLSELRWMQEDYFGFDGGRLPRHIILSKSIGSGGLRVLYTMPTSQLLRDGRSALITASLALAVFTTAVLLGACLIRRRLLLPARRQQETLLDNVSLNRKLVAMAPVGLALVNAQGDLIFQKNSQAQAWMDGDDQWRTRLPKPQEHHASHDVLLKDGRTVRVHAITLGYRGDRAALCSIIDLTTEKAKETALSQARQLAENANMAKTQFLTTMSHEIRTPLYGILGTLELISLSGTGKQHVPYMDTLRRSAETLFHVVGKSLDLSRIEAGHVALEPCEFRPQEQIDEVIAAFAATAQNKGLLLYSVMPVQALAPVIGDPLKIRQILSNLVSNAIKFTLSGHVVLRLHMALQPGNHVALRFQVTDSGQGISAEALPNLFVPYFRQNSNAAEPVGTGLGLPICQRLANLMDGSLAVISEPGLGTSVSFKVALPLASPEMDVPTPPRPLAFQPVYVAGDIPEIIITVCKWLRHWGAYALPYDGQPAQEGAILLQTWPSQAGSAHAWTGRQVLVLPSSQTAHQEAGRPDCFYAASTAMGDIARAVRQAQSPDTTPDKTVCPRTRRVRKQRVLVVDDNPVNRQILEDQLALLGCTTHLEARGESALSLVDKDDFDVVLTDLLMPGMDGYALARALRARGYRGRVIGITANAILDKDQEWSAAGMDALLIKPLLMATLRDSLFTSS